MALDPVIGSIGASLIGGLFGRSGQSSANAANERIARENRAFQERMSSTAYQRATKDLEKAGLNRILALGSPSSSPAGSTAVMQNEQKPLQEGIQSGVTSALSASLIRANIANINANKEFTDAKRRAIGPAEQLGGAVGDVLEEGIGRISGPVKGLFNPTKGTTATINTAISKISTSAKQTIHNIAKSMGMRPEVAAENFLTTLRKMDTPPNLTDAQLIEWGIKNINKVERFNERQKQQGHN